MTGFWGYKVPDNLINGQVIFNNNNQGAQYPASGQPGLRLNGKSAYLIGYGSLVDLTTSGVDDIDTAKATITVNGSEVSVSDNSAITLYNLQGAKVAASESGAVTAPSNGVYIAVAGSHVAKIIVR